MSFDLLVAAVAVLLMARGVEDYRLNKRLFEAAAEPVRDETRPPLGNGKLTQAEWEKQHGDLNVVRTTQKGERYGNQEEQAEREDAA